MNDKLIAAEQAVAEAERELSEARSAQAEGERQISAGEGSVSAEVIALAPIRVRVTEGKLEAAKRALRAAEDAQPLPTAPAVRVSPDVAAAGKVLDKAQRAAEAARSGLAKAEDALVAAQAKHEAAEATLAEAIASDPGPALHVAKVLVEAGAVQSNVEVAKVDAALPRRGTLPLLRVVPGGGRRVLVTYLARNAGDAPPDEATMTRALSVDGWRGGATWDETEGGDGSILAHAGELDLTPRATAAWAEWTDTNGEDGHDLLDGLGELFGEARHALRGDSRHLKVYTHSHRAPLAHSVDGDGLHRVTVGLGISHYTTGSTPLRRGADGEAMAKVWAALIGATDWMLGVVTKVEPVKGLPAWAADVPMRIDHAGDASVHYGEITTAFRVGEGRSVRLEMLGLAA